MKQNVDLISFGLSLFIICTGLAVLWITDADGSRGIGFAGSLLIFAGLLGIFFSLLIYVNKNFKQ